MQHVVLCDRGSELFLIQELERAFHGARHQVLALGMVSTDSALQPEAPPILVFSRQLLPFAELRQAESISQWAHTLLEVITTLAEQQPWLLHVVPRYGAGAAGQNRCHLIQESVHHLLRQKRRQLFKALRERSEPFTPDHSLVQLLLTAPDKGWISVCRAPIPYQLRRLVWPFAGGELPIASDKAAPSRAFAKLLEAEQRLGRRILRGERCVDLGASPGSWSYVALQRGADVTAVDRAPLREDLMTHPHLQFQKGDAFRFEPTTQVDWVLCDVIAAPERSVELLLNWTRHRRTKHFVVTIKFKGTEDYRLLEHVKHALPPLCDEFFLTRLCANKNEVCAFGSVA